MAFRSRPWHRGASTRGIGSGQRHHNPRFPRTQNSDLPKVDNLQKKIESILSARTYGLEDENEARIENVEYVTSYNWKEGQDPTILVPGKPPKWQPPTEVRELQQDAGIYFRDPNSARFPLFPIEPAIRAILIQNPYLDLAKVDVFGCGNTFGSLLSFVRDEEATFRFGVELIGKSLFLVRKTNSIGETIEEVRGYGHAFPENYTVWEDDIQGSCSHQRIIKYDFAGLKCFLRSECDGYIPDLAGVVEQSHPVIASDTPEPDQLPSSIIGLGTVSNQRWLFAYEAGRSIPQEAVFDLKTRGKWNIGKITVDNFLHRLWVNQTPNFILAFHASGKFEPANIHLIDAREKIKDWETDNISILSQMGGLIRKLISVAKSDGHTKFEVRREGSGPIELWTETARWAALPDNLKILWPAVTKSEQSPNIVKEDSSRANAITKKEPHDASDEDDDEEEEEDGEDSNDSDDGADYLQFKAAYY